MDGVRRWFQRRKLDDANISSSNNSSSNSSSSSTKIRGQVSVIPELNAQQEEKGDLIIETDFDISGLKLIRVPKRAHISRFPPPMDPQKKVLFF